MDLVHELCSLQLLEVTKKKGHLGGLIGQHTAFGSYTTIIDCIVKVFSKYCENFCDVSLTPLVSIHVTGQVPAGAS